MKQVKKTIIFILTLKYVESFISEEEKEDKENEENKSLRDEFTLNDWVFREIIDFTS
jgi:hypothetical protein